MVCYDPRVGLSRPCPCYLISEQTPGLPSPEQPRYGQLFTPALSGARVSVFASQ